jgi:hypothetical protein
MTGRSGSTPAFNGTPTHLAVVHRHPLLVFVIDHRRHIVPVPLRLHLQFFVMFGTVE